MYVKTFIGFAVALFLFMPRLAIANVFEDPNDPISFKVELLPWQEVNEIIPKYSIFEVVDVETGKKFMVQRRAGNKHADVQPLTRKDTKIMKEIYKGKWSWKRKAILVLQDDKLIAGSMHGMPHGAGALSNGFPGHFCIHFSGSTTHRSSKVDLSHKVMILKAAGKIDDYIDTVNPFELIGIYIVAVNHNEGWILKHTLSDINNSDLKKLRSLHQEFDNISIKHIQTLPQKVVDESLVLHVPVEVEIYYEEGGLVRKSIDFVVKRQVVGDQWTIEPNPLIEQLKNG